MKRASPSKKVRCSRLGPTLQSKLWLFLKMAASSAILDELEELFGQDLTDDYFISTIVNMVVGVCY